MVCTGRVCRSTLLLLLLASHARSDQGPFFDQDPLPTAAAWQAASPRPQTALSAAWTQPPTWTEQAAVMPSRPRYGAADWTPPRRPRLWSFCQETRCKVCSDLRNYYSWSSTADLLLGIAAGSLLANTSMDQDFQDWYQDDVRSQGTDDFCDFWKGFGDGRIVIPACAGLALAGEIFDHTRCGSVAGELGWRTTRAYLVGAPPMLFMQACLGGSRPGETRFESRWRPFEDTNSVSGHAFVGAVPFITAAKMTDNRLLKAGLYLCSTFTAWSRVDHDRHYLSQACLGWWMAYLACGAVDNTERQFQHLTLVPIATPNMVGVGAICEW